MPPIEEQEYYILSVVETAENEAFLCFASEAEVNGVLPVTNNLKEALVSKEHLIEDEELIYIEKSKVDNLSFGTIQERKHVDNNRDNRIKLGLKYKDGHLQRATGIGVEEDYVLLLECASPNDVTLSFLGKELVSSNDLRNADICELPINKESIYVNKEKVDGLVTLFPNGAKVLLSTDANLNELGLVYQDRKLCQVEPTYYYALSLTETKAKDDSVQFFDDEDQLTTELSEACPYVAPLPESLEGDYYFVPKALVNSLSSNGKLANSPSNLNYLGLKYCSNSLKLQIIGQKQKEEEPEAEQPIKETTKEEGEKEVNWIGLGLKVVSLGFELKEALKKIKAPKSANKESISTLADEIHQVNKAKGFWNKKRNIGEMLMLVTSELGEGMEALRKGKSADWNGYKEAIEGTNPLSPQEAFEYCIKDSFEDEIADAVIRLLDMAAGLHINIEKHIRFKLDYNRSRGQFHGKSF